MAAQEDSTAESLRTTASDRRAARASGLRPRVDGATLAIARERRVLRAMLEVTECLRGASTLRLALRAVISVMEKLFPLRAVALVPVEARDRACIWCASRRDHVVAEVEALAASVLAWVGGIDGHDPFDPLAAAATSRLRWMLLPLVGEHRKVVGMLAVSTADGIVDESRLGFVACVAANLTPFVARTDNGRHARASMGSETLEERARAVVEDLTTCLFDSLDYAGNLRRVSNVIAAETRGACMVRVDALANGDGQPRATTFVAPAPVADDFEHVVTPISRRVLASASPCPIHDPDCARAARALGIAWLYVVPLQTPRACLGAMAVAGPRGASFPMHLAEVLARRAAVAVENGQAYEDAMRAVKHRDDLLSTVSHDLKNPLSIISLSAERMLEEPPEVDPVNGRRRVEAIQRSALRMRKLVSDLLDLTAADAGALSMRARPVAPSVLVEDALDGHAALAADAGLRLVGAATESLCPVLADVDRIHQVLSNLIGNAIKFTPPGGIVSVAARSHGDEVAISVADTGCGIPESDVERVFDRHWQGSHDAKPGSGLGLAICKSIVELLGGRLWVESELGVGSTFTFTLPVATSTSLRVVGAHEGAAALP